MVKSKTITITARSNLLIEEKIAVNKQMHHLTFYLMIFDIIRLKFTYYTKVFCERCRIYITCIYMYYLIIK